jgi:cation diffusion facilitator family transporter
MHEHIENVDACAARRTPVSQKKERGVNRVVVLTAAMMCIEIVVGYATHSMALLADGWHMATHVGALGLASAAYWVSRRYASHRAFGFGTGKVRALAGFTSALALGIVAVAMVVESAEHLVHPHAIDFMKSLPVAIIGLVVNLASVALLHTRDDHQDHTHPDKHEPGAERAQHYDHHEHSHDHGCRRDHTHHADEGHPQTHTSAHERAREYEQGGHSHDHHDHAHHGHDHNHQAAFMHVVADALTSVLAIAALLAGRFLGWTWLDAVAGIVGGLVILKWGASLARTTSFELLDVSLSSSLEDKIRRELESHDGVHVMDLHLGSLGSNEKICIVTLAAKESRDVLYYHQALARFGIAHLTIEVRRAPGADHANEKHAH